MLLQGHPGLPVSSSSSLFHRNAAHTVGFSTLKVYRKGEAIDYSGPRKADGIVSYMVK